MNRFVGMKWKRRIPKAKKEKFAEAVNVQYPVISNGDVLTIKVPEDDFGYVWLFMLSGLFSDFIEPNVKGLAHRST